MEHNTENLEHFSASQSETSDEKAPYTERPLLQRIMSWFLIAVVLFGFLGMCYWIAFYGKV